MGTPRRYWPRAAARTSTPIAAASISIRPVSRTACRATRTRCRRNARRTIPGPSTRSRNGSSTRHGGQYLQPRNRQAVQGLEQGDPRRRCLPDDGQGRQRETATRPSAMRGIDDAAGKPRRTLSRPAGRDFTPVAAFVAGPRPSCRYHGQAAGTRRHRQCAEDSTARPISALTRRERRSATASKMRGRTSRAVEAAADRARAEGPADVRRRASTSTTIRPSSGRRPIRPSGALPTRWCARPCCHTAS